MVTGEKSPCLNCVDRKLHCHNNCNKYNIYKRHLEKAHENKNKIDINRSATFRPKWFR